MHVKARIIVAALLVASLYAGYVGLNIAQRPSTGDAIAEQPDAGAIALTLVPESVNASGEQLSVLAFIQVGDGLTDELGQLTQGLKILITPTIGEGVISIPPGEAPPSTPLRLRLSGDIAAYPLDRYNAQISAFALQSDNQGDIVGLQPLTTRVTESPALNGWRMHQAIEQDPALPHFSEVELSLQRSVAITAIAILLLLLMVLVSTLAIAVVSAVVRGRRALEFTYATWLATLIFAMIAIRNFMPGNPPVGSWLDILIFFWVEVILIGCLATLVGLWLARAPGVKETPEP